MQGLMHTIVCIFFIAFFYCFPGTSVLQCLQEVFSEFFTVKSIT